MHIQRLQYYTIMHFTEPSKHPPRCALHRGQVATVHAWPGYQVKWGSAGQCFNTSARLKVTTSNWKPCGFSKSWTETRFPPISVWFRCDSARRLGTNLRSASSATSCPQERHSSSSEQPRASRTQSHHSATTHSAAGKSVRSIPRENNTLTEEAACSERGTTEHALLV